MIGPGDQLQRRGVIGGDLDRSGARLRCAGTRSAARPPRRSRLVPAAARLPSSRSWSFAAAARPRVNRHSAAIMPSTEHAPAPPAAPSRRTVFVAPARQHVPRGRRARARGCRSRGGIGPAPACRDPAAARPGGRTARGPPRRGTCEPRPQPLEHLAQPGQPAPGLGVHHASPARTRRGSAARARRSRRRRRADVPSHDSAVVRAACPLAPQSPRGGTWTSGTQVARPRSASASASRSGQRSASAARSSLRARPLLDERAAGRHHRLRGRRPTSCGRSGSVERPRRAPAATAAAGTAQSRCGDEMDGGAHQRRADRPALGEQVPQLLRLEALQPRPQPDVRSRPAPAPACLRAARSPRRAGQALAREQELPGEQGAVYGAPAERVGRPRRGACQPAPTSLTGAMSDSSSPAVEVRGLVREFKGGIRAVDGLDLEVERGRDLRLPRAQRRGQDDLGAHPHHAAAADRRASRASPATTWSRDADAVRRVDRRRAAGGGDRPADDRPRAAAHAGRAARAARRPGARRARRSCSSASGSREAARPPRRRLLGRHAPPARPRARARAPAARAVPRRADHRPRPDQPRRAVARGARAQRRGHHGLPHHPVPRGGRAARRPRRHHRRAARSSRRARRTRSRRAWASRRCTSSWPTPATRSARARRSPRSAASSRPTPPRRAASTCAPPRARPRSRR